MEICGDEHGETPRHCTLPLGHDAHWSGGTRWTYLRDDTIDKWRTRAEQAQAAIARVRAIWDEHRRDNPLVRPCTCLACRMHAALDQPGTG